jgi:hypothetical protein
MHVGNLGNGGAKVKIVLCYYCIVTAIFGLDFALLHCPLERLTQGSGWMVCRIWFMSMDEARKGGRRQGKVVYMGPDNRCRYFCK